MKGKAQTWSQLIKFWNITQYSVHIEMIVWKLKGYDQENANQEIFLWIFSIE